MQKKKEMKEKLQKKEKKIRMRIRINHLGHVSMYLRSVGTLLLGGKKEEENSSFVSAE